jgi:hypothetical protein
MFSWRPWNIKIVTLYSEIVWLIWDFLANIYFSIWFKGAREWALCYPNIAQCEHIKVLSLMQTISKGFSWIEQTSWIQARLFTSKFEPNSTFFECYSMLILINDLPNLFVTGWVKEKRGFMLRLILLFLDSAWYIFLVLLELIEKLCLSVKGGVFFILGASWDEFVLINSFQ